MQPILHVLAELAQIRMIVGNAFDADGLDVLPIVKRNVDGVHVTWGSEMRGVGQAFLFQTLSQALLV